MLYLHEEFAFWALCDHLTASAPPRRMRESEALHPCRCHVRHPTNAGRCYYQYQHQSDLRRFAVLMYVYRPVCEASLVIMKLPPLIAGAVRMNTSCSGGRADHCHVSKSMRSRERIHTSSGYQGFPKQYNSNHYKSGYRSLSRLRCSAVHHYISCTSRQHGHRGRGA